MIFDVVICVGVQIVVIDILTNIRYFISEPLSLGTFDNQGSHVADKISAENHVKGHVNHYKYHLSDIDGVDVSVSNSGHGNNGEVEGGHVTLPEVDISEVRVGIVTHLQATDPRVTLLGGRHGGSEIIENACSGVGAVKFNDQEFDDSGEEVIDPGVLLEGLEELGDSESTTKPYPKEIANEFFVGSEFVNVVPWEAAEKVEDEAR